MFLGSPWRRGPEDRLDQDREGEGEQRKPSEIHQRVNHPALVLIFDGGNLVTQGFDAPGVFAQYKAMKDAIGWFHMKDYKHPGKVTRIEHVDEEALRHFVPADEGQSGHELILKDVKTLKGNELPDYDLLTGGFPCQGFSVANKYRDVSDERNELYLEIVRILEETNPKYYNLIKKFKEITNCPILVNTSFNVRGEPIVCSVKDAFRCFMGTNLDVLVCENFILYKDKQNSKLLDDYKNKFKLD